MSLTESDICIFKRIEKKYCLTLPQKERLLELIGSHLIPDAHGKSTICSLYLDTADFLLIRNSLDADVYKEKLRLRSYGTPTLDSQVFLEIKKKYLGVVYKRRVAMTLAEAERYLEHGIKPCQSQIMSEIDYAMEHYLHPKPSMLICYEREAFFVEDLPNLRLTFDTNIRSRSTSLRLEDGTAGTPVLSNFLLEVKTDGAMPIWLAQALDQCRIFPTSFSKYGAAYCEFTMHQKGDRPYACNF